MAAKSLEDMMRAEFERLLVVRNDAQARITALSLLIGASEEEALAVAESGNAAPVVEKKKKGRRSNAQIAADKAAAEAASAPADIGPGKVAELTDEDEKANEAAE